MIVAIKIINNKALIIFASLIFFYGSMGYAQYPPVEKPPRPVLSPGPRNAHVMCYDRSAKRIVLFGGADEKQVLNDTWIYKKNKWHKLKTKNPGARTFANLVYDNELKQLILFGGNRVLFGNGTNGNHLLLNDTWILKNNKWQKKITAIAPMARAEAAMAYDNKRKRVVLFGGYKFSDNGKEYIKLGDTWEFDGNNWVMVDSTGPSKRNGAAMIFDEISGTCILYGGSSPGRADSSTFNGQCWSWDGKIWQNLETNSMNVYNPAMTYDYNQNIIFRYGGYQNRTRLNSSCKFNNSQWTEITTLHAPAARNHAAMVYDGNRKCFVLFGGHDGNHVFGDLWYFKNGNWYLEGGSKQLERVKNGH
jgi:Galactose oxidase, central domain